MPERIYKYLGSNMAFSATALQTAYEKFKEIFEFTPQYPHIEVSIEDIFNGIRLMNFWLDKDDFHYSWWISCNRNFSKGHWELSGGKDGIIYSIYSDEEH